MDFRLISATNRRLIDLVKEGTFREDLYYRLNVFPIWIPPLRDRLEDIPALTRHFLARFAAEEGKPQVTAIAPEAMAMLQSYHWPGNIRQLENTVFRAVVLCDGARLTIDDFPQVAAAIDHPVHAPAPAPGSTDQTPHEADVAEAQAAHQPPALPRDPVPKSSYSAFEHAAPFGFMRNLDNEGHVRKLADVEEELIRTAINHYAGRMTEVAKRLGIGRSTLYRKLKEYGLEEEDESAGDGAAA